MELNFMKEGGYLNKLFGQLYNSKASTEAMAKMYDGLNGAVSADDFMDAQMGFAANPLNTAKVNMGAGTASGLGNTAKLLGANIAAHPWMAAGTGLNAVGNIAGLVDNDKLLGQIGGTAAGAILPMALGMGLGPLGIANAAMIGGNLGALFDTLRSKREKAAQMPASYTTY